MGSNQIGRHRSIQTNQGRLETLPQTEMAPWAEPGLKMSLTRWLGCELRLFEVP